MSDARTLFDRKAAVWDTSFLHDPERIRSMLLLVDIAPHSVILDVGCGTGVLEHYLLAWRPSVVLGVDFSPAMIEEAKKKLANPAVRFLCADIFDVEDVECDQCFVLNTFLHFPNPEHALAHITTLIRPGGRLTISHALGAKDISERFIPPAQEILQQMMARYCLLDIAEEKDGVLLVSGTRK